MSMCASRRGHIYSALQLNERWLSNTRSSIRSSTSRSCSTTLFNIRFYNRGCEIMSHLFRQFRLMGGCSNSEAVRIGESLDVTPGASREDKVGSATAGGAVAASRACLSSSSSLAAFSRISAVSFKSERVCRISSM